jgi:hypothetical protein
MKAIMLLTGDGALVILTSYTSATDYGLLKNLKAKGIDKFVAQEIPLDLARQRYGQHFAVVANDLRESDDLRILDYSGSRAFRLFAFHELGPVIEFEATEMAPAGPTAAEAGHVRRADDTQ